MVILKIKECKRLINKYIKTYFLMRQTTRYLFHFDNIRTREICFIAMFPYGSQSRLLLLLCSVIFQYLMELQSLVDASTLSHSDVKQIIKEFLTVTQHIDSIFGMVWPFNYLSCTYSDILYILGIVRIVFPRDNKNMSVDIITKVNIVI